MNNKKVYGVHGEGRVLCQDCAERIYSTSLDMYVSAGELHRFSESDGSTYASKGLLCDDCSNWIFEPAGTEDPWWITDPDPEEHLRLLAPFASFLEKLEIETINLVNLAALGL